MALNDILANVATTLGIKDTEVKTLEKAKADLKLAVERNYHLLDDMKERFEDNMRQLRLKKTEYEKSSGGIQTIVRREIELLFQDKAQMENGIGVVVARIAKDSTLIHKLDTLIYVLNNPTRTEIIGDTLDGLEIAKQDLKEENGELGKLEQTKLEQYHREENLDEIDDYLNENTESSMIQKKSKADSDFDNLLDAIH